MIDPIARGLPHIVAVEVDPAMHYRDPEGENETLTWAVLDTTWKLLREYAVRLVLTDLRAQAVGQGVNFPSDEELFAQDLDDPEAARNYLDLAAEPERAGRGLHDALQVLYKETYEDAQSGFRAAQDEREG